MRIPNRGGSGSRRPYWLMAGVVIALGMATGACGLDFSFSNDGRGSFLDFFIDDDNSSEDDEFFRFDADDDDGFF